MTAKFLRATNLHQAGDIRHGFFSNVGGVSDGIYSSLNCGYGSGDDFNNVKRNRELVAEALESTADYLFTPHQVHSATAVIADKPWAHGEAPEADAIVTNVPGLRIGILSADCTPLLFADPEAKVVGAAHSGWKGAINGVAQDTIEKMESLGAVRERIQIAIGPTISQNNYEVGSEYEDNFLKASPENADFFKQGPNGKAHFDLPGYIARRLEQSGIDKKNVEILNICTYSNDSLFFSYRRTVHQKLADYGRQISAIGLK